MGNGKEVICAAWSSDASAGGQRAQESSAAGSCRLILVPTFDGAECSVCARLVTLGGLVKVEGIQIGAEARL